MRFNTCEFNAAISSTEIVLLHERTLDHETGPSHTQRWLQGIAMLAELLVPNPEQ